MKARVTAKVKTAAAQKNNVFTPASALVEEAIADEDTAAPLPAPGNIARAANRLRRKHRPDEPHGLDFELSEDYIPEDFLVKDIRMDGARHILFSAPDQLALLARARTWYVDGTFKITREPFHQLFSVHAFIKGDCGNLKQVPLAYAYMTRRSKKDYKKVLKALKRALPTEPRVEKFVMDFEWAMWDAAASIFSDTIRQGCSFHFSQAIWRKVQDLGLVVPYNSSEVVRDLVHQLMALPFIPAEHVQKLYEDMERRTPEGPCQDLLQYFHDTWMTGNWSPKDWCVYGQGIHTNNDVEGWHPRLNGAAWTARPSYVSLPLLHKESETVRRQVKLVKRGKLARYQRVAYRRQQGRIFELWDKYEARDLTTKQLLKACSHLTGPTEWSPSHPAFPGTYGFPAKVSHHHRLSRDLLSTPNPTPPPTPPPPKINDGLWMSTLTLYNSG